MSILINVATGTVAPSEVLESLLTAEEWGEKAMGELVQTWLISGKENFWDSFEEPQLNLIEYNTNLIATDLQRKPNCYNAQKPIDQALIAIQFYASGCLL